MRVYGKVLNGILHNNLTRNKQEDTQPNPVPEYV
jgi:hypothetical protein